MNDEDRERLVRIEGAILRAEDKLDIVVERTGDHETRIRAAEHKLWATLGALPIIGTLIGGFLYKLH